MHSLSGTAFTCVTRRRRKVKIHVKVLLFSVFSRCLRVHIVVTEKAHVVRLLPVLQFQQLQLVAVK